MLTYLNKGGNPIVRQCENCIHFNPIPESDRTGYCKKLPLIFAYTGKATVFAITRNFYFCQGHEFVNEQFLKENSMAVEMKYKIKQDRNH